jgi:hypothetical protein
MPGQVSEIKIIAVKLKCQNVTVPNGKQPS